MGELCAAASALFWAVAVVLFRKSGETVPPVPLNVFKNAVATVAFLVTVAVLRLPLLPDGVSCLDVLVLVGSGILGIGLADSLFFASLNRLGAGRQAIVDCLYSPCVLLWSVVYLHEPVQIWLILSIGLMLVAILVGAWRPSKTEAERSRRELPTGVLLGAASMIAVSASVVFAKPVYLRVDLWWASTVRILGGMAFLAVHGLLPAHRSAVRACFRPNRTWRVAIPAALLGAYLAMFFWIAGMRYTYAATAAVINQLSTIFILILATIALGEPLTARKCLAVLLAAAAAVMAIV